MAAGLTQYRAYSTDEVSSFSLYILILRYLENKVT